MKHHWQMFIGLTMASGLVACGASHAESATSPRPPSDTAPAAEVEAAPIPVTLAPVVAVAADAPLVVHGRVTHARDHKPAFKTGGVVAEVLVDEGDVVAPGQLLARLDARQIDAGMAQARAALDKARRDLARVDQLVGDDVLPSTTRDDAGTAAAVARAQLAGLAFDRATTTLVATAPGVVVKRLAEPGEILGPGMPVLVIGEVAAGSFRLEVGVPARELSRLALGDVAEVELDGRAEVLRGMVVERAPTLTPGTDRLAVTLEVTGEAPRGLVGHATFAPRAALVRPAVPLSTIVEGAGRDASVWLPDPAREGQVVRRAIVVERVRADGLVLVASGLDGVREVIDAGNAWLDPEARIVVKPAAKPATTTGTSADHGADETEARHEDR